MSSISIQFHAMPEELHAFVKEFVSEFQLCIVGMQFPPFLATKIDVMSLDQVFADVTYRELAFTVDDPKLPASGNLEFAEMNPDALWLRIGQYSNQELRESWLSSLAENTNAFSIWKVIAKRLRRITQTGAIAINSKSGASVHARNHRFTAQALEFQSRGVQMLDIGGSVILKLGSSIENKKSD